MKISSRFTIAIHILACIDIFKDHHKITSDFLAGSIGSNPVIIRNILLQLKAAGFILVTRGSGGTTLLKSLEDISFLDIYRAVNCVEGGNLFHFHENPNPNCPVGKHIHDTLGQQLEKLQNTFESKLADITMKDVIQDLKKQIKT